MAGVGVDDKVRGHSLIGLGPALILFGDVMFPRFLIDGGLYLDSALRFLVLMLNSRPNLCLFARTSPLQTLLNSKTNKVHFLLLRQKVHFLARYFCTEPTLQESQKLCFSQNGGVHKGLTSRKLDNSRTPPRPRRATDTDCRLRGGCVCRASTQQQ